jgi:hypothetical protein
MKNKTEITYFMVVNVFKNRFLKYKLYKLFLRHFRKFVFAQITFGKARLELTTVNSPTRSLLDLNF